MIDQEGNRGGFEVIMKVEFVVTRDDACGVCSVEFVSMLSRFYEDNEVEID